MPTGKALDARYRSLLGHRQLFEPLWELLAPYIDPSRVGITKTVTTGQRQTQHVYDSTGQFANDLFAKFLMGSITNAAQKWSSLRMRHDALNRQDDVREWLEESRDRMHAAFNASNFYAEAFECYKDYGGFGTGSLLCTERPQPEETTQRGFRGLRFEAQRIGRYVVAENAEGRIQTMMRAEQLSAAAAMEKFGHDKLPEKIRGRLSQPSKIDQLDTYIHAIVPRPKGEAMGRVGARGMPFASVYYEQESTQIVLESGFADYPAFHPRMDKTPGETWGRGRGHLALDDLRTLNTAKRMGFEDWALKIRPPMLVASDSVIGGTIRWRPAGPTVIDTKGRAIRDVMAPMQTGSHPEVSQIKEEELRRSIRQTYFVDQILAMLEVDKPQMTAYEFSKKLELLFKLMGPFFARFQSEFLDPLHDRVFNLMYRQGAFSPPPDVLLEVGGDIDVEYHGTLARAQRMTDVDAMNQALATLLPLAEAEQRLTGAVTVLDKIDFDKWTDKVVETQGVPASVTRSEDEITALRQARQAQQQAAQKQEQLAAVAQAAGHAAPMVKAVQGQGA